MKNWIMALAVMKKTVLATLALEPKLRFGGNVQDGLHGTRSTSRLTKLTKSSASDSVVKVPAIGDFHRTKCAVHVLPHQVVHAGINYHTKLRPLRYKKYFLIP